MERLPRFALALAHSLVAALAAGAPAGAATLPEDFQEIVVISGRTQPTAIRFASGGGMFLAEKSGLVWFYDDFDDASPTMAADLRASVHNFWDRGLLGMAVHPDFPATPHVYVLYAHDTWPPGDPRFADPTQPRWGTGLPSPSTADPCPSPPGPTADGCVVFGRLSRLVIDTGSMTGTEQILLQGNWCQQYPSHSTGDLVFGEDGYLYVSAGDGASFNFADWGQDGSPVNPCDDPPDGIGGPNNGTNAEGGALRSQDILTPSDPTSLDGAILRLDVSTTPPTAPADNPLVGNGVADDDFIVAIGLRNPFRINKRPGTDEIWITDVGWSTWEELNRLEDATGDVEDFGWPCYEGGNGVSTKQSGYQGRDLCRRLYGELAPPVPANVVPTAPYYAYRHDTKVVPGELCGTGSSSATGVVFNTGGNFPPEYDGAVFFADSSRQCVWTMFAGGGDPNPADIEPLVSLASGRVVDIQMTDDGRLYYVDFDNGRVYRVEYFTDNQPPTAHVTATPESGLSPLLVDFDGSGSSDPEDGGALAFAWDLDGDGDFDDSTAVAPGFTYVQPGAHLVRLRAEDSGGASDVASIVITVDNTPPVATIVAPAEGFEWHVGEDIDWEVMAIDPQDGPLPASQLSLDIILHHCATPEDCHTHPLTTVAGAATGSFEAPDHPYPSYLELVLTAADLPPADWLDRAWGARRMLTFDNSAQAETLVDFPVLVTLDPTRIDYAKTQPGGTDLRFADASGTPLPHEIEAWIPGGTSRVWVRAPSITGGASGDGIFLYYDNPAAADAQDPAGVWSNGYAGVWHLSDLSDSTANGNDGVNHGTTATAGRIGSARSFDLASWIDAGSSPSLEITGQLTLEAWIAVGDPALGGAPRVLSKKDQWNSAFGYNLEHKPAEDNVTTVGSGSDYIRAQGVGIDTNWRHVATTVTGATGRVYVDAVDRTTDTTLTPLAANSQPLDFGRRSGGGDYFLGAIDEIRISNVARSADWIAAQHLSMTDALVTYGPEEGLATLTHSVSLLLDPETVDVTFESAPAGLDLAIGSATYTTPVVHTLIVGSGTSVSALEPQQQGNAVYDFAAWSDAGAQSHVFVAPAETGSLLATYAAPPACDDGLDNDGDSLADLADPGCLDAADPSEQDAALACDDGIDNDGDSLADLADPGCAGAGDPSELDAAVACDDGVDNDGDSLVDAADPGCAGPTDPSEQDPAVACDDGADNDGDSLVDFSADPDCDGPQDPSETTPAVPLMPGWGMPMSTLLVLAFGARRLRRRRAGP